jgi:hypothetical protein
VPAASRETTQETSQQADPEDAPDWQHIHHPMSIPWDELHPDGGPARFLFLGHDLFSPRVRVTNSANRAEDTPRPGHDKTETEVRARGG